MPLNPKHWLTEPPLWPWGVFFMHLFLGIVFVASCLVLIHRVYNLKQQIDTYGGKLITVISANQKTVEILVDKSNVPDKTPIIKAIEHQKTAIKDLEKSVPPQ